MDVSATSACCSTSRQRWQSSLSCLSYAGALLARLLLTALLSGSAPRLLLSQRVRQLLLQRRAPRRVARAAAANKVGAHSASGAQLRPLLLQPRRARSRLRGPSAPARFSQPVLVAVPQVTVRAGGPHHRRILSEPVQRTARVGGRLPRAAPSRSPRLEALAPLPGPGPAVVRSAARQCGRL